MDGPEAMACTMMNKQHNKKIGIVTAGTAFILWLVFSFSAYNLNPATWNGGARFLYMIITIFIAGYYTYNLYSEEADQSK